MAEHQINGRVLALRHQREERAGRAWLTAFQEIYQEKATLELGFGFVGALPNLSYLIGF